MSMITLEDICVEDGEVNLWYEGHGAGEGSDGTSNIVRLNIYVDSRGDNSLSLTYANCVMLRDALNVALNMAEEDPCKTCKAQRMYEEYGVPSESVAKDMMTIYAMVDRYSYPEEMPRVLHRHMYDFGCRYIGGRLYAAGLMDEYAEFEVEFRPTEHAMDLLNDVVRGLCEREELDYPGNLYTMDRVPKLRRYVHMD